MVVIELMHLVYQYFNIFGDRDIDVLRVNVEDKNRLTERFWKSL